MTVKDRNTKELLPGSPFAVTVEAQKPVAAHSSAVFGSGVDKMGIAVAGEALTVRVALKDRFGNPTEG